MDLHEKLKAWRKSHGLTQEGAARRLGVPFFTYIKWERAQGSRPRGYALAALLRDLENRQDFQKVA